MKSFKSVAFTFIIILFSTSALAQDQNTTELFLDKDAEVLLEPQITYTYLIQLPEQLPENTDFYFVAQWPVRDPLQKPKVNLDIQNAYNLECSDENNQYSGVCSIASDYLYPNTTILAQITCYVQCQLTLSQFISKRLQVNLGDEMIFKSPIDKGIPIEIQIQIPQQVNFTQIALYAQIMNFQDATGGLEMLANIGDSYTSIPTLQYSQMVGESIYWGGKGIFLSQEDISKGDWIKLYLFISQGMSIKFSSNIINGNVFSIDLEKAYFDFTSRDEDKLYILDLSEKADKIKGKTVGIGFIVYSGDPVILISMDSNFNNKIQEKGFVSSTTYLITEPMRNQMNFSGHIYIKVSSNWDSDYYFYTEIDEGNYMSLFPDLNFYSKLEPLSTFNYFFEDIIYVNNNSETLRNYSIKVEMIKGTAIFGVRHCRPAQNGGSPMNCIINRIDEITDQAIYNSFQEIPVTIQQSQKDYHLAFQVKGSDCQLIKQHNAYYCYFHILALEDKNNTSEFTLALNKRVYASSLREGELSRNMVFMDEYLYFKFSLTSIEDILSITFYLTVLQGDLYLVSSTTDEFPSLQSEAEDLLYSSGNSLTYQRNQLAHTIYLAVYGLQLSQFTLGVQVTRAINANITTPNSTNLNSTTNSTIQKSRTKLDLHLNLSQEFIFQQIDTEATFLLNPSETMNITVEVILLAGVINLNIIDENGKNITCDNKSETNSKITCSFEGVGKKVYEAKVTATKGQIQRFIILYYKSQQCIPYTLNLPFYLQLSANQKQCIYFTLTKSAQLQVTTSVPLSNLFKQTFQMSVCLNEHCMQQSVSHHLQISKSQINSFCKFGGFNNSKKTQSCTIKLQIQTKEAIDVQLIVEEKGKDIGLFDGIPQKITVTGISHTQGKYLYYDIYDWSAIKIFFTSLTTNSYYIAMHFIEEKAFLANTSNIYPDYRETKFDLKQDWSSNIYEVTVRSAYTQLINIPSQAIDKYCEQCLLTIAIYPWYVDSHAVHSFEIEVSQTETLLFLGDSRIDLLQEYQIFNYQLQGSDKSDSLVMLRDLSRQSSSSEDCFEAGIAHKAKDNPTKLLGGVGIVKKGSKSSSVYVSSYKDQCNYEITYMQLDIPLVVAKPQRKYQVSLDKPSKSFLLYKHNSKQSFKIVQIINTGALKVSATPITNRTLQQLSKDSGQSFPYISDDSNGELFIDNTTSSFCSNCQYFIILEAIQSVKAQVMILYSNNSIVLGINGIIKSKIKAESDIKYRNFSFYSISAFNISVNIIYGSFSIKILDPSNSTIINEQLSKSKVFRIPHNKQTQNFVNEYNSPYTKYEIIIQAISDCSFTIKASKTNISERLFQGLPTSLFLNSDEKATFEFLNLNEADSNKNSLNVLIEIIQTEPNGTYPALSAGVILENNSGQDQNLPILSQTKSDNTINLEIILRTGTYYVTLSFNQSVKINIILVKQTLVHLQPSTSLIMSKQQVFQLYSEEYAAMIEVFQCWGESSIEASSVYADLEGKEKQQNQIVLEQNNYGGHYVVSVDELFGEYFIKIKNKKNQQKDMSYLITYYYYEIGDTLPYKLIDLLDREIIYSLSQTSTIFKVEQVGIKEKIDFIDRIDIEYRLYIADNKNKVSKYANCRLGEIASVNNTKISTDGTVEFEVDNSFIKKSINNQNVYFVGAEAIVYITTHNNADPRYPKKLRLIYETIELTSSVVVPSNVTGSSYTLEIIVIWFLLPFVLASIMLYFALKYCLGRYRSIPNELMEQDPHGESNQAVQLANMNNASQSLKDQV